MSHYTGSVPETTRAADWRNTAACLTEDPELFFPKGYEGPWRLIIEEAKDVCRRCPSMDACAQWALETRQPFGVWGGLSEGERRSILRRRGIRIKDTDPEGKEPPGAEATTEATMNRNKVGRPLAECGTASAYDRHIRNGEPVDQACRKAHARKTAEYRRTRSAKATA